MPQKSSAGSQAVSSVSIQNADFDAAQEYAQLRDSGVGTVAIATFTGLVRDSGDRHGVTGLFLEHYPGMTEQIISDLITQAGQRWDVRKARVIHRIGHLPLQSQIVFVGVCSAHRGDAFAACEFIMDCLLYTSDAADDLLCVDLGGR